MRRLKHLESRSLWCLKRLICILETIKFYLHWLVVVFRNDFRLPSPTPFQKKNAAPCNIGTQWPQAKLEFYTKFPPAVSWSTLVKPIVASMTGLHNILAIEKTKPPRLPSSCIYRSSTIACLPGINADFFTWNLVVWNTSSQRLEA